MKLFSALLALIFLAGGLISGTSAQSAKSPLRIVPSNIIDALQKKLEAEPNIEPTVLAKYANDLLAKKGFDFQFDLCEFINQYNPTPRGRGAQTKTRTYKLPMKQTDGVQLTFETGRNIEEEGEGGGMCGECFVSIPATKVTAQQIELLAGGKKYLLVRPRSFHLDEMSLVDQTMRKVLRTWQVPSQGEPLGVSSDGTKLYLDTGIESLILEISETSALRFVAREEIKLPKGEEVAKHPTDPKNAYLSFMRFRFGGKSLVLRYSEPCT
jgi:hypothetical protein